MPLTNTSTGELVTAAWLNAIVDRINAFLVNATGGIWTGTVQKVIQSFRGLYLRTHPNFLAAPSQVAVLRLDEAVMSDGTRYLPPRTTFPLLADISVTGAGGRDTGTEAGSAWYEIYLIGKSSTNATSDLRLLLHLAKRYTLDQSQTLSTTSSALRLGATTQIKLGQSFQTSVTGLVEFIDIQLSRTGTPTGTIWLTLEASSGGNPSGTALATSDKLDATAIHTNAQWIRFPFRSPATLTLSTQYFIVLQGDYATSGTAYVAWLYQATNVYGSGQYFSNNGSSWSASVIGDQTFKAYVTLSDTALTMPAGYDQSLKLGYVYNNSSLNFVPFVAFEKDVRRLTAGVGAANDWAASTTVSYPTLFDLSTLLPPSPVIMSNIASGASAGMGIIVGGVPDGFGTLLNAGDFGDSYVSAPVANYAVDMPDIFTEYQGAYLYGTSANAMHVWLFGWRWLL